MNYRCEKRWVKIPKQGFVLCVALIALLAGASAHAAQPDLKRPNILWITGEDMSAKWLACYGNKQIKTPTFDQLADEGFLYTHCFAQSPVCAPARSGWMMGMHPTSIGTVYMRSKNSLPNDLVWYVDALRANGYYASNFTKTDYNTDTRRESRGGGDNEGTCGHYLNTWDSYERYGWRNPERKPDQPFFQVINAAGCHESFLHKEQNTNQDVDPAVMELASNVLTVKLGISTDPTNESTPLPLLYKAVISSSVRIRSKSIMLSSSPSNLRWLLEACPLLPNTTSSP